MFDTIPTSIWLAVTTTGAVLIFLALWLYLWHSHLVRNHDQHVVDLAIFETRKEQLEAEIKERRKWLDENKDTYVAIEEQRQKRAKLKDELGKMQATRIKEEAILEEIRKKNAVLKSVIKSLTREQERVQARLEALNIKAEEAKLEVAKSEKAKMVAALRANKALMNLKTKQDELKELTELYDKKYAEKPLYDSTDTSPAKMEKRVTDDDQGSNKTDGSSEIHISVI